MDIVEPVKAIDTTLKATGRNLAQQVWRTGEGAGQIAAEESSIVDSFLPSVELFEEGLAAGAAAAGATEAAETPAEAVTGPVGIGIGLGVAAAVGIGTAIYTIASGKH